MPRSDTFKIYSKSDITFFFSCKIFKDMYSAEWPKKITEWRNMKGIPNNDSMMFSDLATCILYYPHPTLESFPVHVESANPVFFSGTPFIFYKFAWPNYIHPVLTPHQAIHSILFHTLRIFFYLSTNDNKFTFH